MKAVWTSALESGNETIDAQHKQLFEYMNNFFDSISKEYGHETTVRTLNFLVKYVGYHFKTEEEFMRSTHCPAYKEHKSAHRKIVDDLMGCYKKLITDGNSEFLMSELTTLLQEWFVNHIMTHDLKLAEYLKEHEKHV